MILQNINNATTLIDNNEVRMLFDPWVVGKLYQNSWSPYPKQKIFKNWFSKIDYIYISHIDPDHWDMQTIKKINKNVKIIIPNIVFNLKIKNELIKNGYKNIHMTDLSKWKTLSKNLSIYIIEPLNYCAQDFDLYQKKTEYRNIAIDTGIIIKDKISNTSHMLLGDNTPYDLRAIKRIKTKVNNSFDSLWFPYNGFAQDYPLCYDNLSTKQKKKKSLAMSIKREKSVINVIKELKPKYLIPHSSDFYLSGPRNKEFFKVHDQTFLNKDAYSKRIEKLTKIKSLALYGKDKIIFNKGIEKIIIGTKENERKKIPKTEKLFFPSIKKNEKSLFDEICKATENMFSVGKRLNLRMNNLSNWGFYIDIGKTKFFIDLKKRQVSKKNLKKKNYLKLKTTKSILLCILHKKIHMNNAMIGNYLSWERKPDLYKKSITDLLNFFHLPSHS